MAVSQLGVKCHRMCRRGNMFFCLAGLVILTQLYIGYSFYKLNQEELNNLRHDIAMQRSQPLLNAQEQGLELPVKNRLQIPPLHRGMRPDKYNQESHVEDSEKIHHGIRVAPVKIQSMLHQAQSESNLPDSVMTDIQNQVYKMAANGTASLKILGDMVSNLVQKAIDAYAPAEVKANAVESHPADTKSNEGYTISCGHVSKEVNSALSRATTTECKQQIADVACAQEAKYMFAETLPRYCPLKGDNKGEYVGCFEDSRNERLLGDVKEEFVRDNSVMKCINYCITSGFKYAGLQYGKECWCGDNIKANRQADESKCDRACSGRGSEMCGGYLYTNVYHTGVGDKPNNKVSYVSELAPGIEPVRIVFVLTINGRADRQVKRLFKAIYHEHHYYYIHVDSRQEYLQREMLKLAGWFPNVRVASRRLSTIWGGSSLLTMLLNCMEDLLSFQDWHWDYFLNLSESDFPVKSFQHLVAFLSTNKEKNFLRAHGSNTPKPLDDIVAFLSTYQEMNFIQGRFSQNPIFIKKQGLDQLFYECDTHMWRLGKKHIPTDVIWSGGSDWICLTKQFTHYVVNSQDELVTGLKQYFTYSLLPAESFFHTVLFNSEYCDSFVNNNLHATNWNRKQGCKCQYKHVVDWCGCSPNDYLPRDLKKLKGTQNAPVYFARKFEHIISSSIISVVELMAVPEIDPDQTVPGLQAYWQNEFHHLDVNTKTADSLFTYYRSFARNGVKRTAELSQCSLTAENILESHVYSYADKIQGLLVLYEVSINGEMYEMESLMQRMDKFRPEKAMGAASRLQYIDIGTSWDPKEETFRNYGRLLGPYDDVSTALWCDEGKDITFSVVYIDPALVIAASYDVTVKHDQHIATQKPDFYKPLRPGVWTVRVLYAWQTIAETNFHVTPLSHIDSVALTNQQAKETHSGPKHLYVNRNFKDFHDTLKLPSTKKYKEQANQNALKTGQNLLDWIDDLSSSLYQVSESCFVKQVTHNCANIPVCTQTKWSSRSHDPKSEVGEIDPSTGMIQRQPL